jgi:hypothetical protein
MTFVSRAFGWVWLLGVLAISLVVFADTAHGQNSKSKRYSPSVQSLETPSGVTARGYVPKHEKVSRIAEPSCGTDIIKGGTHYEDALPGELLIEEDPMAAACPTDGSCKDRRLVPCYTFSPGNLELFAGVEGFTGPGNRGGSGSFGFNQGVNWAFPINGLSCLGGQVGFRVTQSSLSGAEFTNDMRNQAFVTGGLFRRMDVGLQCGLVVDYLSDDWYRDADLLQLRGELSWVVSGRRDFGLWFAAGTKRAPEPSPDVPPVVETWESTDLFAFFYRERMGACLNGSARVYAGFTGQSDGLIGADLRVPFTNQWALETGFAYLVPKQGQGTVATMGIGGVGHAQESWNLGINLVWYPGQSKEQYYRPLFSVADNGCFMLDIQ